MKLTPAPLTRNLSAIAREIQADYTSKGKPVHFSAVPYVEALTAVHSPSFEGEYGFDDVEGIVIRLLGNLSTWRGETATRVRNELKAALAHHQASKKIDGFNPRSLTGRR